VISVKKFLVILLLSLLALSAFSAKIPKNTLVIGANTGILITFDPAQCYEVLGAVITSNLYDALGEIVVKEGQFTVVPAVAESWEVKEDGKTWIFHIRKGIKFYNGDPLTAEDVVFSLKRVLKLRKPPVWLFEDVLGLTENSIEKIDDYTVKIVVSKKLAPNIVLSVLSGSWGSIVNKKEVLRHEKDGDLGNAWLTDHSAGSGPYYLKVWKRNEMVVLEVNKYYWKGEPPIKRVIFKDIPEENTQYLMIQKGDIDIAWNLTAEQALDIKEGKVPGVRLVSKPAQAQEYVAVNVGWGPFKDPRVRMAIKLAIDYEAIIKEVRKGLAIDNFTFLPVGYLGYKPLKIKRDVEKAKKLLAEAGYPDGFEVTILTNPTAIRKAEAVIVQSNLAEIGIKANIQIMQASQMYTKYRQQGHQMIVAGWGVDFPDPAAQAAPFADYTAHQLAWRNMWYDDFASKLTKMALEEMDPKVRTVIYNILIDYWFENGPFAILYQPVQYWAVREEVKGAEEAFAPYNFNFLMEKFHK